MKKYGTHWKQQWKTKGSLLNSWKTASGICCGLVGNLPKVFERLPRTTGDVQLQTMNIESMKK